MVTLEFYYCPEGENNVSSLLGRKVEVPTISQVGRGGDLLTCV